MAFDLSSRRDSNEKNASLPQNATYDYTSLSLEITDAFGVTEVNKLLKWLQSTVDKTCICYLAISLLIIFIILTLIIHDCPVFLKTIGLALFFCSVTIVLSALPFWLRVQDVDLFIVKPGSYLPSIIRQPKANQIYIATRILHPKFHIPQNQPSAHEVLTWLNSTELLGLKTNIIRAVLLRRLKESSFLTKLKTSLNFHSIQVILYTSLLLFTLGLQYEEIHSFPKWLLYSFGIIWFICSILLYSKQINDLSSWLEQTRNQHLSIHLPIFIWNTKTQCWDELSNEELNESFLGDYGIDVEKIVTLGNSVLLANYLLLLKLYD